jgi:hypothetical protein
VRGGVNSKSCAVSPGRNKKLLRECCDRETMGISFAAHVSVPEDVLVQQLQGESVLLNLASGRYFGLDDMGTRMWAAVTSADSLQAAYEALLAEYDVDRERLERDFRTLIEKLVEHGLLEVRSG